VNGFGFGRTDATTRRGRRSRVARIAGSALGLALVTTPAVIGAVVPAQAATTTATTAGVTWSQLMQRKLDLSAQAVRLTTLLPSLRATAVTRTADLTRAQAAQTAATTTLTTATVADQAARSRYAAAKTAVGTAQKAVAAEQKRRPVSSSRVAAAKKALVTAEAAWHARASDTGTAAAALTSARTARTVADQQAVAATIAYQAATKAITDAQVRITGTPALVSTLAGQAATVGPQVVTQSRATFTVADTTKVYGITVNKIIAYPFQRMIDDAAAAGVQLSGGGFRTRQQQIALRIANGCPDVYTAPSSSCKVPTAIPGRSLHELGLAVDMTSGQKTISSHASPAFKWLAANAGRYGFTNLPAEPWHWSITGN
jgi:zinc D-Ala-D-Ala carboxypeptidase